MKSWKTNLIGIGVMAAAMVLAFAPGVADRFHQTATDVVMVATGVGLVAAKDHDK